MFVGCEEGYIEGLKEGPWVALLGVRDGIFVGDTVGIFVGLKVVSRHVFAHVELIGAVGKTHE